MVDWSNGAWQIGSPFGKFGTFTLMLKDSATRKAGFQFSAPRIFIGIDIYNDGDKEAVVQVSSGEEAGAKITVRPKELRRFRTGWTKASSQVQFELINGSNLRFDNLAYRMP